MEYRRYTQVTTLLFFALVICAVASLTGIFTNNWVKTGSDTSSPGSIALGMDANYGLWTTCYKEVDKEESCINSFLIEEPLSNLYERSILILAILSAASYLPTVVGSCVVACVPGHIWLSIGCGLTTCVAGSSTVACLALFTDKVNKSNLNLEFSWSYWVTWIGGIFTVIASILYVVLAIVQPDFDDDLKKWHIAVSNEKIFRSKTLTSYLNKSYENAETRNPSLKSVFRQEASGSMRNIALPEGTAELATIDKWEVVPDAPPPKRPSISNIIVEQKAMVETPDHAIPEKPTEVAIDEIIKSQEIALIKARGFDDDDSLPKRDYDTGNTPSSPSIDQLIEKQNVALAKAIGKRVIESRRSSAEVVMSTVTSNNPADYGRALLPNDASDDEEEEKPSKEKEPVFIVKTHANVYTEVTML